MGGSPCHVYCAPTACVSRLMGTKGTTAIVVDIALVMRAHFNVVNIFRQTLAYPCFEIELCCERTLLIQINLFMSFIM